MRRPRFFSTLCLLTFGALAWNLTSCAPKKAAPPEEAPTESAPALPWTFAELELPVIGSEDTLFETQAASETGLNGTPLPQEAQEASFPLGDGVLTLGDVDGDGWDDVLVTAGPGSLQLFRQTAPLRFEDITREAGLGGDSPWATGAAMGDLNNDGHLDILVCQLDAPNQCYLNNGEGQFSESAASMGLDVHSASLLPALADYDNDGDLDVYLVTYRFEGPDRLPDNLAVLSGDEMVINPEYARYYQLRPFTTANGAQYHVLPAGQRDLLLRNRGDGTFENVSGLAGDLGQDPNQGTSAAWLDHDGDGDLDLYVTSDGADGTQLYRNEDGKTFQNITTTAFPYLQWNARANALGDIDGDGLTDLLSLTAGSGGPHATPLRDLAAEADWPVSPHTSLWQHTGTPHYQDVTTTSGLGLDSPATSAALADFDNDGLMDVIASGPEGFQVRRGNRPPGRPEEIVLEPSEEAWGLTESTDLRALAVGDLDQDGDLDLISQTRTGKLQLHQNSSIEGARLVLHLISTQSATPPVGATIEVEGNGHNIVRTVHPGSGSPASGRGFRLSMALPLQVDTAERLVIRWPSGAQHILTDQALNQRLTAIEPEEASERPPGRVHPLFQPSDMAVSIRHEDLRSSRHSPSSPPAFYGPGMACADVDSDGFDDVFVGGAAGLSGKLYLRKTRGFRPPISDPFAPHAASEDIGAVFADFDADGHLDLYVVSGGNEAAPGDPSYQDRLYKGNGRGGFTLAEGALPELFESGGMVSAGDYDEDGDLDLFVTGEAAPNRLLENQYFPGRPPKFGVVPFSVEGQISGVVWSDFDQDEWLDLLLVDQARGARIFHNQNGQLKEQPLGFKLPSGPWGTIAAFDSDTNGTIDYAITHLSGESGLLLNDGAGRFTWDPIPQIPSHLPARGVQWLDGNGDGWHDLYVLQNQRDFTWPERPLLGGVGVALRRVPEGGFEATTAYKSGFVVPGAPTSIALTEVNGDEAPDLLVARNNQSPIALQHRETHVNWLSIRFHGALRNVAAIGARISIEWRGQLKLLTELYGGSGFMAQSPTRIFFPRPAGEGEGLLKVTWPDGSKSSKPFDANTPTLLIRHRN